MRLHIDKELYKQAKYASKHSLMKISQKILVNQKNYRIP